MQDNEYAIVPKREYDALKLGLQLAELNCKPKMYRVWAMPNGDTFSVKPIGAFVRKYLAQSTVSVDPFARNMRGGAR